MNTVGHFKPKSQRDLKVGDSVAVQAKLMKPYHYPRGIIPNIKYNNINDVKAVTIRKTNREQYQETS